MVSRHIGGLRNDQQVHPLDDNLRSEVHRELAAFLRAKRDEAAQIDQQFATAVDSLSDFVLGPGKRLRPVFAWWGWRGAGGSPVDPQARAVLRSVSSLELIHACALVHDDLMDDSITRRGVPTMHVDFATRHHVAGWSGTPERFGASTAILLGDIALAWADDMLRGSELGPDQLRRAHSVWQAMRTEVLAAQYLDVLTQARGDEAPETALRIDRYKNRSLYRSGDRGTSVPRSPERAPCWCTLTAASAPTSVSPSSSATTCWACSATLGSPVNQPAM